MNTGEATAKTLKLFVWVSIAVILTGIVLDLTDVTDRVLYAGILVLIISPLAGVAVTTVSLYLEKDMKWVAVALVLIAISAIGMIFR